MLGLTSYHQVRQETQIINQKINEMADGLAVIGKQTSQMIEQLKGIEAALAEQAEERLLQDFRGAITDIEATVYEKDYLLAHNDQSQKIRAEDRLWDAYIKIASLWTKGFTASGKPLLTTYRSFLAKSSYSPQEETIRVTLWFREMLDYQMIAFKLFATLRICRQQTDDIPSRVSIFERKLIEQIELNRENIDIELIYESKSFIEIELANCQISEMAQKSFKEGGKKWKPIQISLSSSSQQL